MTHAMLLLILKEAEDRAANFPDPAVRARSQETVDLVHERLRNEGITRAELEELAKHSYA